jgi:hypothetical protein
MYTCAANVLGFVRRSRAVSCRARVRFNPIFRNCCTARSLAPLRAQAGALVLRRPPQRAQQLQHPAVQRRRQGHALVAPLRAGGSAVRRHRRLQRRRVVEGEVERERRRVVEREGERESRRVVERPLRARRRLPLYQ